MAWLTEPGNDSRAIGLVPSEGLRIGRSTENDLVLANDVKVSRRHAEMVYRQGTWWIRDRGSRNGTWVNGEKVGEVAVSDGDRIRIGGVDLLFRAGDDPLATLQEPPREQVQMPPLSSREREVLAWVASGATDVQISRALGIRVATVHSHLDRIREKTGRRRRPDLTRLANELGLELPGGP